MKAKNDNGGDLAGVITLNQPALISASEMARELGVPESQLRKMARENRVPHYRIGKYVRFDPREVREYMRRETTGLDSNKGQYA
jgi:excisionase family DNA binding protein